MNQLDKIILQELDAKKRYSTVVDEDEFDKHLVAKGMESDIDMELVALDECLEELNKLNYLSDEVIASKYSEYEKFWEEI